jgi:hypothetical protein
VRTSQKERKNERDLESRKPNKTVRQTKKKNTDLEGVKPSGFVRQVSLPSKTTSHPLGKGPCGLQEKHAMLLMWL